MLNWLGRWAVHRKILIVVAWAIIAVAGAALGGTAFDNATTSSNLRPGAESAIAKQRLAEVAPEGKTVVAVIAGRPFAATSLVDSATRVLHEIRGITGVRKVNDAYTSGNMMLKGDKGQSSVVIVELQPGLSDDEALAAAGMVKDALHRIDAPQILVGGEVLAQQAFADQAIRDAAIGESIALGVLCVVLVLLLGGYTVASMPLATAVAAVTGTLLVLAGISEVAPISEYTVNVVTLLGLGLSIDYALLLLMRFQEERAADPSASVQELMARTLNSSGRAVLVSGMAVAVALAGLFLFADPLLAQMALGGTLAVCLATLAGLTLTPAAIALWHQRIPAPGASFLRRRKHLTRLASVSQRRPKLIAVLGIAALAALSAPLWSINLANSDARSLPTSSEEHRAHQMITADLGNRVSAPVTVLIPAAPTDPGTKAILDALEKLPGVDDVYERETIQKNVTVADIRPLSSTSDEALVRLIRATRADIPYLVAGPAAELVDAKDTAASRLPAAFLVIAAATGLLLFALTGSVVVPLKALCLNLFTLAATLGILVAVFQWGWGASVLGFQPWGALDLTTPLLLFVFIFGISMDYQVFLLARIKEHWDQRTSRDRKTSDQAVLAGITATGPVITTAAIAIGLVFLGFALGQLVAVKEIGIGMTVAVLLDVTVIRGLLLPAVMSLLGRHNWWPAKR